MDARWYDARMISLHRFWTIYAKALGVKPEGLTNREADIAAAIRTVIYGIPALCIIANCGRTFGIW